MLKDSLKIQINKQRKITQDSLEEKELQKGSYPDLENFFLQRIPQLLCFLQIEV